MRMVSEVPNGAAEAPGVVVMMHGPGLDRFIEDRVAELARAGYAAAAPDLYHRQPADDVDTMTRVGRLRDDEIVADIDAAVAHLRELARPRVTQLAVLGFCMGGRNTYLAAGARPAAWRAACVFYGGNIMKPWATARRRSSSRRRSRARCSGCSASTMRTRRRPTSTGSTPS